MAKAKKLPSGSWRALAYAGKGPDGKRKYQSFTAETKKEAEYLAAQFQMGIRQSNASSMSLHEAGAAYISARSNVLSPWTITSYQRILERDFMPLHHVPVKDLSKDMIQRFINTYARSHSPKSTRNVHGLLSSVLSDYAPDLRLTTKLPGKVKTGITIPTDDQILTALRAASGYMPLIIQIGAMLGLRRAEICALTWADIANGSVSVSKAFAKDPSNNWVIKAPKSFSGTRSLPIPPALHSAIMATRPEGASDSDFIFPVNPDYITKHWYRLCQECGFSCRFHDLRHYNASVMLSLGVPDKYAMQRMGHATPNMLKTVYQHIMADKEREEAAKIDAYMSKFSAMQHEMQHRNEQTQ